MTSPDSATTDQPNRRTKRGDNRWNALWLVGSAVAMAAGVAFVWHAAESTTGSQMTPMAERSVALAVTLSLAALWTLRKWVPSFVAEVIDDIGGSANRETSPMLDGWVAVLTAVGAAAPVYFAVALTTTGAIGNDNVVIGLTQASMYALLLAAALRPLAMVWHAFRDRPARTTAV